MLSTMQAPPTLIGTEDAAAILGVDRSTVTRRVQRGMLTPAHTLKNGFLFDRDAVERLAQAAKVPAVLVPSEDATPSPSASDRAGASVHRDAPAHPERAIA